MKPFAVRTISGTVFVAVMLTGLLVNARLFGLLTSIMAFGMLYEYIIMPRKAGWKVTGWNAAAYYTVGTVYIVGAMVVLNFLAFSSGTFSGILPLCFFLLIWSSDVGAYCVGSTLGKRFCSRKMAPTISPNKTWTGFWGGLIFCIAAAAIMKACGMLEFPLVHCLAFAVLVGCVGMLGDLLESAWKRFFGVKDSGNVIPGHGGMLDRFDSSLAAIPVGTLYLLIFNLI